MADDIQERLDPFAGDGGSENDSADPFWISKGDAWLMLQALGTYSDYEAVDGLEEIEDGVSAAIYKLLALKGDAAKGRRLRVCVKHVVRILVRGHSGADCVDAPLELVHRLAQRLMNHKRWLTFDDRADLVLSWSEQEFPRHSAGPTVIERGRASFS
jgi:hypothetical protein